MRITRPLELMIGTRYVPCFNKYIAYELGLRLFGKKPFYFKCIVFWSVNYNKSYLREGGHDFNQRRIGVSRHTWVALAQIDHVSRIPAWTYCGGLGEICV